MTLSDDELIAILKDVLKRKGVSLRALSDGLNVPYRSVQNYVGGETRMPAAFLMNACAYIGIEPSYFYNKDFRPEWSDLYDAVFKALEQLEFMPAENAKASEGSGSGDGRPQVKLAAKATALISEGYDRYRTEWLNNRLGAAAGRRGDPHVADDPRQKG